MSYINNIIRDAFLPLESHTEQPKSLQGLITNVGGVWLLTFYVISRDQYMQVTFQFSTL